MSKLLTLLFLFLCAHACLQARKSGDGLEIAICMIAKQNILALGPDPGAGFDCEFEWQPDLFRMGTDIAANLTMLPVCIIYL